MTARWRRACAAYERAAAAVTAAADERAAAAAEMHDAGLSYADIAALVGLTRARVQQLVERARVAALE